ncbi:hypothetical protein AMELA_G00132520 [Ameiurus melas]|uniref:Uncharacterized protein n=1 Tax=Ameiurus melas TaxID=219545 RepID=A0A7J6AJ05_AMEME|nr:hypothetical protein AMELA_G00132520 [Ameiurus melas]
MGNTVSEVDNNIYYRRLLRFSESSHLIPDVGIDESLVKYSGLNSAAELESSITRVLGHKSRKTPDYVESLGSALTDFKRVSNAVGLGGLVLSMDLELIITGLKNKTESKHSTLGMMRRVFAEEKASGVRDSMDEYLKRLCMNLHRPTRALEETERLEKQLSEQLTRLKNSMLHDNQMSSRSLKHWANGAAFHLQMLLHAARLKIQCTTERKAQLQVHLASINTVLDSYQFDLEELIKQYKTYKKSTISFYQPGCPFPNFTLIVEDEELERVATREAFVEYPRNMSSDEYVDYMFDNWSQLKEVKSYFSDLKEKVKDLILENYEFNLQKVLPFSIP